MNAYVACKLKLAQVKTRDFLKKLVTDENGDTNFVAIILICVIVIALAITFKDTLEKLMGNVTNQLTDFVGDGAGKTAGGGE